MRQQCSMDAGGQTASAAAVVPTAVVCAAAAAASAVVSAAEVPTAAVNRPWHGQHKHQHQPTGGANASDRASGCASGGASGSTSGSSGGGSTRPGVVVRAHSPTACAVTLRPHSRRRVAPLRTLGRWETAGALLVKMGDARNELAPGVRHYVLAACAAAVADDFAFDKRVSLDGCDWGDGSSSSIGPSGSSLSTGGSSRSRSISAALVSTAAVNRYRQCQKPRQRRRRRHA